MVKQPDTPEAAADAGYLSIGEVAQASGIGPDTIRVWERRYGRPRPVRLSSGHRRYTRDQVRWLRRVAEALARGHRPSAAVPASDRQLDELLGNGAETEAPAFVMELLELVRRYDRAALEAELRKAWKRHEAPGFLTEFVAPLVTQVGRAWSDGSLEVRHEHFLSEVLEDVLRSFRLGLDMPEKAPTVLLTTLPGEMHGIGLQMASLLAAYHGVRPRILGTSTPLEEILRAASETGADAVGISVSLATGGVDTDRQLQELRKGLPEEVHLVIGGRGARGVRRGPRGVEYADGLEGWGAWLAKLADTRGRKKRKRKA